MIPGELINEFAKIIDMNKPLTAKVLWNPNHDFVKTLLYIYSMQTFIFGEMNLICRNKDLSKIQ